MAHTGDRKYIVAVESGGSHCRAILFSKPENKILRQIILHQPANIHSSRESAGDALNKVVKEFSSFVATPLQDNTQLTLCLAGTEDKSAVAWLEKQLQWPGGFNVTSDVMAGFFGVFGRLQENCGMFIGGTGNVAVGYTAKEGFLRIGGMGGEKELCCGYSLGWHALMSKEMCTDARFQKSCVEVAKENNATRLDLGTTSKYVISQLAPHIFDLAENEHMPVARALVEKAAAGGFSFLKILHAHGISKFGLIGGVVHRVLPLIKTHIEQAGLDIEVFLATEKDGLMGALCVAQELDKNVDILKILNKITKIEGA